MGEKAQTSLVEKILQIRSDLLQLKKTGTGHKYTYFELSDFIPTVNKLEKDHNVVSLFSFDVEKNSAYIILTDGNATLKTETPIVYSKMSANMNPIQDLGATHTYLRRYLYMALYNIVENDLVEKDANNPNSKEEKKASTQNNVAKEQQLKIEQRKREIINLAMNTLGISKEDAIARVNEVRIFLNIDNTQSMDSLQKLENYFKNPPKSELFDSPQSKGEYGND